MKNSIFKKNIYLVLFTLPFLIISINLDFKVFFINIFFIFLYLIFVIISEKNKNDSKKYVATGIVSSILSFSIIFLCYYIPIHIIDLSSYFMETMKVTEMLFIMKWPIGLPIISAIKLLTIFFMFLPLIIIYIFINYYFVSIYQKSSYKLSNKNGFFIYILLFIPIIKEFIFIITFKNLKKS